ncbi:glycosyltransferase family 4 protein [Rhodobium gokarnense]|uniref:Glycosyltransferase involved in cell wall biosynthesis n=1 Tax=Rhodobium gokarnense TaxID=364296 RepID=A0ABT3HBS6_9HYPH|nr:glycosyltransferase family 4 protein [Rhodobium gokarnense]MCW2307854.1 glycosyltransferase involved in cell wall biosynthesis [Rhodobium gokarnense]
MRIAFYAPMKPPDHDTPSGDRLIARLLIHALEEAGHEVVLASRFRSWVREPAELEAVAEQAAAEAARVIAHFQSTEKPDLFLTYHLYHKAPDWIGPRIADALFIPYAVIEASRAMKRARGPWASGFAAADAALARADAVAALHEADAEGLRPVVGDRLEIIPPFLDTAPFAAVAGNRAPNDPPVIVTAAMMRPGNKADSYRLLAEALARLTHRPWRHVIAGDGPERGALLPLFDPARTDYAGRLEPEDMPALYARGDIFAWPAVTEPFGMVFLEAQAAGLAIVAGAARGVPDIVADGATGLLVPPGDVDAFAAALDDLLADAEKRQAMGRAAARHAAENHDISQAVPALNTFLSHARRHHAARS